jgi:hypothetical protein
MGEIRPAHVIIAVGSVMLGQFLAVYFGWFGY